MVTQRDACVGPVPPLEWHNLRAVALRDQRARRCQRTAIVGQPDERSPVRNTHGVLPPAHGASSLRIASEMNSRSTSSASRERRSCPARCLQLIRSVIGTLLPYFMPPLTLLRK